MSVEIAKWIPDVFIEMGKTQCPPDKITKAIILSLQDFCTKTLLWEETLDRISIVANTQQYSLSHASGNIISVVNVLYKQNGLSDDQFKKLNPTSEFFEDNNSSGNWNYQTSTTPTKFYIKNDKTIYLIPTPTEASGEGLLVKVYLKPLSTATVVEDFFYNDHQETITLGAVSKLLSEEGVPWGNIEVGLLKARKFINQCNDILGVKTTGYTNRPLRVKLRRMV